VAREMPFLPKLATVFAECSNQRYRPATTMMSITPSNYVGNYVGNLTLKFAAVVRSKAAYEMRVRASAHSRKDSPRSLCVKVSALGISVQRR
jgi:hypothetical protein